MTKISLQEGENELLRAVRAKVAPFISSRTSKDLTREKFNSLVIMAVCGSEPPQEPPIVPIKPSPITPTPPTSQDPGPGTGLWMPKPNIFVFDRTESGTDTHVPGCIPREYVNCQWGQNSRHRSVMSEQVWAMRIPYNANNTPSIMRISLNLAEAGGNLALSVFDVSVSTVAGDFDSLAVISKYENVSIRNFLFIDAVSVERLTGMQKILSGGYPRLQRNTLYYFNVRSAKGIPGTKDCGSSPDKHCKFRISMGIPSSILGE